MQRRQALRMLPGLPALCMPGISAARPACVAPHPQQPAASGIEEVTVVPSMLVWGPGGSWIVGTAGAQALPAGLPPVAVAGALWAAGDDGQVRRWQAPAAGTSGPPHWSITATYTIGAPVHALAASKDGRHALVAHGEQVTLVDANARLIKHYVGRDLARTRRGAAGVLLAHAGRRSFVAAWPALGELWEIPLDPNAPPIHDGLVHDYRLGEALPSPGHLGVRRVPLGRSLLWVEFTDARVPWVAGRAEDGVAIVHLDVRRRIATLALPAAQPGAAALIETAEGWRWWLPAGDIVHVVDAARWTVVESLQAPRGLLGLRAIGPSVWSFGASGLQRWHDGAWRFLADVDWPVTAFEAGHGQHTRWLATTAPSALLQLDADAVRLARLPLPEGALIVGVAALDGPGAS